MRVTESCEPAGWVRVRAWRLAALAHEIEPLIFREHRHTEVLRLAKLRAGAGAGDHIVGLLRHRARDLGAEPLGHGFGLVAGHLFERAGEDHGLARHYRIGSRALRIANSYLGGKSFDAGTVMHL